MLALRACERCVLIWISGEDAGSGVMSSAMAFVVAAILSVGGTDDQVVGDGWHVELPTRKGSSRRNSVRDSGYASAPVPRLTRSAKPDDQIDDYVLPDVVTEIYRERGYELPRFGAPPPNVAEDAELGRGFAGNIKAKLEALQRQEGVERRGIGETPGERQMRQGKGQAPLREPQLTLGDGAYARLQGLHGPDLMRELERIGLELMERYPVGTPVGTLRRAYGELVKFVSERTGVSVTRIYRVMDLESYGGQYWAHHSGGASGLVQVMPIALAEMQRLRPGEFNAVAYSDVRFNPALNLYTGMSYAQEKHQDWNHYSGGARGYSDYVLYGVPKGSKRG